ncbi:MAG TPA: DUF559 domain-containing protein [Solirubrobacterales bacterium]|nr:DUF559 domain-containing protein [Solirubrobacterales bacterium]
MLACGPGATLSHRSAAGLWGLTNPRTHPIDVTAAAGRKHTGISLHECGLERADRTEVDGIPVTTVARTLLDLAELLDADRLERAWEEADRLRLLEFGQVEEVCARGHGRHGLKSVLPLLRKGGAGPQTRSPLEDRFARFCEGAGLPRPAFNVLVLGHEVDVLWPDEKLIVEVDGFEFHAHRAAFERDRRRDTARQAAGYRVLRVTHRRLEEEPESLAREIRALLDRES